MLMVKKNVWTCVIIMSFMATTNIVLMNLLLAVVAVRIPPSLSTEYYHIWTHSDGLLPYRTLLTRISGPEVPTSLTFERCACSYISLSFPTYLCLFLHIFVFLCCTLEREREREYKSVLYTYTVCVVLVNSMVSQSDWSDGNAPLGQCPINAPLGDTALLVCACQAMIDTAFYRLAEIDTSTEGKALSVRFTLEASSPFPPALSRTVNPNPTPLPSHPLFVACGNLTSTPLI